MPSSVCAQVDETGSPWRSVCVGMWLQRANLGGVDAESGIAGRPSHSRN